MPLTGQSLTTSPRTVPHSPLGGPIGRDETATSGSGLVDGALELPHWNGDLREWTFLGRLVKRFRQPADSQELVLVEFERIGYKNDAGSKDAIVWDVPFMFPKAWTAEENPTAPNEIKVEFATFAYGIKGKERGKWYEGVTWTYTLSLKDFKAGKTGTIDVKDSNAQGPSWEFMAAFDKFNENMGVKP